ncbi:MAG: radical SAM protein [Endomicrobiales bacterium]
MASDLDAELKAITAKLGTIPKYPRVYPPYRVHWNWDISFKCNFGCSYCEVIKRETEFKYTPLDLGKWREVWDRMFELYWCTHVRFSGGEPSLYPGFWDLVALLLEKHTVDVTTNLSSPLKDIMDRVPPGGLSISASFHPQFADMDEFLEKVKRLHFNGYPSTIAYVGYPPHLHRIPEYKKRAEAEHIYFKLIPFIGTYNGRQYPPSYTPEERLLLEGLARDSHDQHLNDMNTRWYEWRVKKKDEGPAGKIKKDAPCRMGQMYAKIHPDGTVTRCCAGYHGKDSGNMGNIADEDFRLHDEALPCQVSYQCPCFKGMVVGQEEEKWVPLWEALEHASYKTEYMKEYADYLLRISDPD